MRKLFLKILLMFLTLGPATTAHACAVCFGDPQSPTMQAVKWGIISLLLILCVVLALFTQFFFGFQKRAKEMAKP